jgi:hypothetical protein
MKIMIQVDLLKVLQNMEKKFDYNNKLMQRRISLLKRDPSSLRAYPAIYSPPKVIPCPTRNPFPTKSHSVPDTESIPHQKSFRA